MDARREGGNIVHVLDKAIPDTVRDLKGTLDWERRFAHMRYHTALHVLSGVIWRNFECESYWRPDARRACQDGFLFPGRVDR